MKPGAATLWNEPALDALRDFAALLSQIGRLVDAVLYLFVVFRITQPANPLDGFQVPHKLPEISGAVAIEPSKIGIRQEWSAVGADLELVSCTFEGPSVPLRLDLAIELHQNFCLKRRNLIRGRDVFDFGLRSNGRILALSRIFPIVMQNGIHRGWRKLLNA